MKSENDEVTITADLLIKIAVSAKTEAEARIHLERLRLDVAEFLNSKAPGSVTLK